MKGKALWEISVTVAREAEEAVAALLERLFGQPAASFAEDGKAEGTVTVYSSQGQQRLFAKRDALKAGLQFLGTCDLQLGSAEVRIRKVQREDWTTSWKKYFKVIEIGRALLIRPSWSKRRARTGEAVVTLDPGLSFGTGQHPTTAFCLRQLVQARPARGQSKAFLDIGTGSGILSIAAAKLHYRPVRAVDNDPVAVRVAQQNARRNRVEGKVAIVHEDLTKAPLQSRLRYDVICANLTDNLLTGQVQRIINRLAPGGKLVLAGMLESQFDQVAEVYGGMGLALETSFAQGGWKSGSFAAGQGVTKV